MASRISELLGDGARRHVAPLLEIVGLAEAPYPERLSVGLVARAFKRTLDERRILLRMRQLECADPLPPRRSPRLAVVSGPLPVAQQVLEEPMLGAQLVLFRGFSRSNQVTQCLVFRIRNPHSGEISRLVTPRKPLRVTRHRSSPSRRYPSRP